MTRHPQQNLLNQRVRGLNKGAFQGCRQTVYRFVNPRFSSRADVLNGKGGLEASGRWNLKGSFPVTYTSLSPETALAESLAHARYFALPLYKSLPKVLVALEISLQRTLDLRDGTVRQKLRLSKQSITTTDWNRENQMDQTSITQAWGEAVCQAGVEALIAPSAADPSGGNVVVFPENLHSTSRLKLLSPVDWQ